MGGMDRNIIDKELLSGVIGSGICIMIGVLFGGLLLLLYS